MMTFGSDRFIAWQHNIINNNNNHDNVYDATIITKVIVRVNPVHLMKIQLQANKYTP